MVNIFQLYREAKISFFYDHEWEITYLNYLHIEVLNLGETKNAKMF